MTTSTSPNLLLRGVSSLPYCDVIGIGGAGMEAVWDIARTSDEWVLRLARFYMLELSHRDATPWSPRLRDAIPLLRSKGLSQAEIPVALLSVQNPGGAGKNPLTGQYWGHLRFLLPEAAPVMFVGTNDAQEDGSIPLVGGRRDARDSSWYFFALNGGTGSGCTPPLIRARQNHSKYHVSIGIYDPVTDQRDTQVNDLWGFLRASQEANMVFLVENRLAFEGVDPEFPVWIEASYQRLVMERDRMPGTDAQKRFSYQMANEYLARMFQVLVQWGRDVGDLVQYVKELPGGLSRNWVVPCLYPLRAPGIPFLAGASSDGTTYAYMALAALQHGNLASGTVPQSAYCAVVYCQVPEGVNSTGVDVDKVVAAVASVTGLAPGDVHVRVVQGASSHMGQVLVLLFGARCGFLDFFSSGPPVRTRLEERWEERKRSFTNNPNGIAGYKQNTSAKDPIEETMWKEIQALDPFEAVDTLYATLGWETPPQA